MNRSLPVALLLVTLLCSCTPAARTGAPPAANAAPSHAATTASVGARANDAPFDASSKAALTQSAARLFREQARGFQVSVLEPLTLRLTKADAPKQDLRISLDRMWGVCQTRPADCEPAVRDFVAKAVHTATTPERTAARDQIVAVLRPCGYLDPVGGPSSTHAVVEPFVGDLCVLYVVDMPETVRSLAPEDLEALKLTRTDLPAIARANLTALGGHLADAVPTTAKPGDVIVVARGNYFESSGVLLTDEWAALSTRVGQPLVVAAPENDVLVIAVGPTNAQVAKLRDVMQKMYGKAERPVSPSLFRWAAGKWDVVP